MPSGTKYVRIQGRPTNDSPINCVSNSQYPSGCTYFIPLTADSAPTRGSLQVNKENATYSNDGALIDQSGEGISYTLPDGVVVKAVAMDFKKLPSTSITTNYFFFNVGDYKGNYNTQGNGAYLWWNRSTNKISTCQMSDGEQPQDVDPFSDVVTRDSFHRVCVASIDGKFIMYMDGERVSPNRVLQFATHYNVGNIVIGNSWRYYANDGDRAFGGYIRNVAIWTEEISESDMAELSTLK